MTNHIEAARAMLEALDGFTAGADLTEEQLEAYKAVTSAACYAAAAYDAAPGGGADVHALVRAFLVALIDPLDPSLDYLRANPAAGQVARDAAAHLRSITPGAAGKET